MDRFACPDAKDGKQGDDRKKWFECLIGKRPEIAPNRAPIVAEGGHTIYAQLQSRLMVNMAGGVMVNAGLCMDRFGMPFIPGSAVKGCARRMAIHQLLVAGSIEEKVSLLYDIALVFGWGDNDWKTGRRTTTSGRIPYSDFWWAMCDGEEEKDDERKIVWEQVTEKVVQRLLDRLKRKPNTLNKVSPKELPAFGGLASFLPAYPVKVSSDQLPLPIVAELGKLELDVLTCHHMDYYRGDREVATDDEDPNPVFFPAVAAGHVFAFEVLPLCGSDEGLVGKARTWLSEGFSTFGIGAKASAGYGWFEDVTEEVQASIRHAEQARKEREKRELEEQRKKVEEEKRREENRLRKEREASMSPEEIEDAKLDDMDAGHRIQWIEKWELRTDLEKEAIYRFFQNRHPELWIGLREKGQAGRAKEKKRFGPVVAALFKMAKEKKERMPK